MEATSSAIRAAISLRDEDGRADLACVHVPTILFHGDKDVVVSRDLVRLQHQGIRGSRLITLENSGHGIVTMNSNASTAYSCRRFRAVCRANRPPAADPDALAWTGIPEKE